ncbi:MAG: hypothetical protein K0R00_3410 [Herbinix sp.]|nr:hypothetical protein [Herbinix sp.]
MQSNKANGSITVFLSLILILVLALLCTIIEGARVTTARVFAERSLATAMDSVLADYYGPLWEEYHVFGYYTGNVSRTEAKEQMGQTLEEAMSFTFTPNKDISNISGITELYGISTEERNLTELVSLVEYNGEIMKNQAVAYEKYAAAGDMAEIFLDKLSLLEEPKKVTYIMEKKQKAETELVKIDQGILKLMSLFDGIRTNDKGIDQNSKGGLKVDAYFVKKIYYGELTMEDVGINHPEVFGAVQSYYCNPNDYFQLIEDNLSQVTLLETQIATLQGEYQIKLAELEEERKVEARQEAIENKSAYVLESLKECKEIIRNMETDVATLEVELSVVNNQKEELLRGIYTNYKQLTELVNTIKPLLKEAIKTIDNIRKTSEKAEPFILEYEELLMTEQENLNSELFEGLLEGLEDLKAYQSTNNNGYDFTAMDNRLQENLNCLTIAEKQLEQAKQEVDAKTYIEAVDTYQAAKQMLEKYKIENLTIDYSTLVLNHKESENILEVVSDLLQLGITSFVIDPDKISEAELTETYQLPSKLEDYVKEQNQLEVLQDLMNKALRNSKDTQEEDFFGDLNSTTSIPDVLMNGVEQAAQKLLYLAYLTEHFGSYQVKKGDGNLQKPSVLQYEQEYLIVGDASDQENLSAVITKIVLVRALLDFGKILSDKEKRAETRLLAAALVGFTGLPILIGIVQLMLLFAWAIAEALLDTAALLSGKELPVLKNKIELQLFEIALINREFLLQKVSHMKEGSALTFSYNDYLKVFLLTKDSNLLSYRSMDLIQKNINLRYQLDNFLLSNCLFGVQTEATFRIDSKFLSFSFLPRQYNATQGYLITCKKAHSY